MQLLIHAAMVLQLTHVINRGPLGFLTAENIRQSTQLNQT